MKYIHRIFYLFLIIISPVRKLFFFIRWELLRKKLFFNYFGYKLYYDKNDAIVSIIAQGTGFENDIYKYIKNNFKGKNWVIDIGANIGLFSLFMLRNFPDIKIVAFEPSPYPFKKFSTTIINNKLNDRICLFKKAVYSRNCRLNFNIHQYTDSSGDGIKNTKRAGKTQIVKVDAVALDDIVYAGKMNKIDLMKIDIEGAELEALKGAQNTLRKYKPIILIEIYKLNLQPYGITPLDIFNYLKKINYYLVNFDNKKLTEKDFMLSQGRTWNYIAYPSR